MANELVPEWLMSDIQKLLKYTPQGSMSQQEFEDEYQTGYIDPQGGAGARTRYYYDYDDFLGDRTFHEAGERGQTQARRGQLHKTMGTPEGYKFHSERDAYEAFKKSKEGQDLGMVEGVDIFDRKSLVDAISKAQGLPVQDLDASMYTAFTPGMFKGLHTGAYQEDIQQGRGSLLDSLMAGKKRAQSLGGGLAGYGQRGAQKGIEQQSYLGGIKDIYSGADKQKSGALQNIYDVLGQYETIGE